jgi:23S rRNA pseudouridine2605 synthase
MSDSPRSRRPQRTGRSTNPNRKRTDNAEGGTEKRGFGSRKSLSDEQLERRPGAGQKSRPSDNKGRGGKPEGRGGKSEGRGGRPQKFRPKKRAPLKDPQAPIRLNKFIANAGVCPRREADLLITAGAVSVNGEIITELGAKVLRTDEVMVEGQRIKPDTKRYLVLNKPKNFLGTAGDKQGRRTVMDLVKNASKEILLPVDKVERMDTGLLLFTNDPELAERMRMPGTRFRQLYHVTLKQKARQEHLNSMVEGLDIEGQRYKVEAAQCVDPEKKPREIGVEIHSNRPKAIARMLEHLGYEVDRLDRTTLGPLTKKDLPRGNWRMLTSEELTLLRMSL